MPCAEGDHSGVLNPKNEGWGSHDSGGRRVRNNKETDAFKLRGSSGTPNPTNLCVFKVGQGNLVFLYCLFFVVEQGFGNTVNMKYFYTEKSDKLYFYCPS